MDRSEVYKVEIDLDRDRIKTVLSESYEVCSNFLGVDFLISKEQFVSKIDPYLDCNRVSIPVFVDLPNNPYPGMRLEVDLRRQKIKVWMFPKKKQAILNQYLKAL